MCECRFVQSSHVLPGWGCCRCQTYNGLQRTECRSCGHEPEGLEVPSHIARCGGCGFGFDSSPTRCPVCGWLPDHVVETVATGEAVH